MGAKKVCSFQRWPASAIFGTRFDQAFGLLALPAAREAQGRHALNTGRGNKEDDLRVSQLETGNSGSVRERP